VSNSQAPTHFAARPSSRQFVVYAGRVGQGDLRVPVAAQTEYLQFAAEHTLEHATPDLVIVQLDEAQNGLRDHSP
jgi:hypothetical protein